MFFRKENDPQVSQIEKDKEVHLFVGDSFGLLVDKCWFSIELSVSDNDINNENNVQTNTNDLCIPLNSVKRRSSSDSTPDSTPDSTTKKIKTEPNEFQNENIEEADETIISGNNDMGMTIMDSQNTANNIPSTSSGVFHIPDETIESAIDSIKTEPIDHDENDVQSMPIQAIKPEPNDDSIGSTSMPITPNNIKSEVKQEPIENEATTSSGQSNNTTQRDCCRHGIRCYR